MVESKEYLTTDDISKMLSISKTTTYKLFNVAGFPAIQIGSKYIVSSEKFKVWMDKYAGKKIPINF